MPINITKKDLAWSYAGYTLNLVSGIILLPLLLKFLSQKELGLWYSFISIGALVNLLDFGFSPTIMRNISYAFCGAKKLIKEGLGEINEDNSPNISLLNEVLYISRKIYFYIALAALLILITIGTYYIRRISAGMVGYNHFIAWSIYAFGIAINLYYSYWSPVLRGIGAIKEGQKATVVARLLQISVSFIGLFFSWGLIALSVAYLFSGIVLRFISKNYFINKTQKYKLPDGLGINIIDSHKIKETFSAIWYNARRIGLVCLGAYLITQANTLICSYFLGIAVTARYGLSLQIFGIISGFASIIASSYLPVLNDAVLRRDNKNITKIISLASVLLWVVFIAGSAFYIYFGNDLIHLISHVHSILPNSMLIVMAIYLLLEANHSIFSTYIASGNEIPFVIPALLSGLGIVISSLLLINYTTLGLWGLLLSQFVIQLLYNNWKWPLVVMKKYSLTPLQMIKNSIVIINRRSLN
jgi:O-antigen/teichoic acid export membrane protein